MNMPGFNAEASIGRASNTYQAAYASLASGASGVVFPQLVICRCTQYECLRRVCEGRFCYCEQWRCHAWLCEDDRPPTNPF
jgi:hypothetical protein